MSIFSEQGTQLRTIGNMIRGQLWSEVEKSATVLHTTRDSPVQGKIPIVRIITDHTTVELFHSINGNVVAKFDYRAPAGEFIPGMIQTGGPGKLCRMIFDGTPGGEAQIAESISNEVA